MGYAQISQRGQGMHLRQFARTYIVDDGSKRVVFTSVDGAMISHPIRRDVRYSFLFCFNFFDLFLILFLIALHA